MGSPFRQPDATPRPEEDAGDPPPDEGDPARVDATALASAILPRNFTVTTDERVRALVAGLPAYVRRRPSQGDALKRATTRPPRPTRAAAVAAPG